MSKITLVSLVVLSFMLQSTVMPHFVLFGSFPDLVLLAIVFIALYAPWRFALLLGVSAGMLTDTVGIYGMGLHALLFPLWTITVVQASKRFSIDTHFNRCVLVFAICLLHAVTMRVFTLFQGIVVPFGVSVRIALWGSLYTAFASRIVLRLASRR